MKYDFNDVDLWIELARKYARCTGRIPESVWGTFIEMTTGDLRLGIYGHHRILRYPTLKKAYLAMQGADIDSDEGPAMIPPEILKLKPQMQLKKPDVMYR